MAKQTDISFPRNVTIKIGNQTLPIRLMPTAGNGDVQITFSLGFAGVRLSHNYMIFVDITGVKLNAGHTIQSVVGFILGYKAQDLLQIIYDKMMYDLIDKDSDVWPWHIGVRPSLGSQGAYWATEVQPNYLLASKGIVRVEECRLTIDDSILISRPDSPFTLPFPPNVSK